MRPISRIATGLGMAILLASPVATQAATKIKIGHTSLTDVVANFVAIEKGFFKKHGIEAETVRLRNGAVIVPGIISNEIQVGTLTAATFIRTLDGGLGLVALNNLSVTSDKDRSAGLMVRKDSGISGPAGLAGKKLGVGSIGSFITVIARAWLSEKGVDQSKTKLVETPMPQLGDVLRNGNVDFTLLPEPLLSRAMKGGGLKVIAYPIAELPTGKPVMLNAVAKKWADAHPDAVKGVRTAIAEATAWAMKNQSAAQDIVAKYLKINPKFVKGTPFPTLDSKLTAGQLDWWVGVMKSQNMLRTDVKPAMAIIK